MMGLDDPGAQRVSISVRDWNAMKLAMWRSKAAWEVVIRAATEIVSGCVHAEGCEGKDLNEEPCLPTCPDREVRMSALVVLGAAGMFAPIDARKVAQEQYWAPTREYYSAVIAECASAQAELEAALEALRAAGIEPPQPPPNTITVPTLPMRRPTPQLLSKEST